MKIRNGFVSNSSSSSFMAVGVSSPGYEASPDDEKRWNNLLYAMGLNRSEHNWEDFDEGGKYEKVLDDYGYGIFKMMDGSEIYVYGGYEFNFIGMAAEGLFNKDLKLSEIKQMFRDTVKEHYNIDLDFSHIVLECGEVSSE